MKFPFFLPERGPSKREGDQSEGKMRGEDVKEREPAEPKGPARSVTFSAAAQEFRPLRYIPQHCRGGGSKRRKKTVCKRVPKERRRGIHLYISHCSSRSLQTWGPEGGKSQKRGHRKGGRKKAEKNNWPTPAIIEKCSQNGRGEKKKRVI